MVGAVKVFQCPDYVPLDEFSPEVIRCRTRNDRARLESCLGELSRLGLNSSVLYVEGLGVLVTLRFVDQGDPE